MRARRPQVFQKGPETGPRSVARASRVNRWRAALATDRAANSVRSMQARMLPPYFQRSSTMRPSFSMAAETGFTEVDPMINTLILS